MFGRRRNRCRHHVANCGTVGLWNLGGSRPSAFDWDAASKLLEKKKTEDRGVFTCEGDHGLDTKRDIEGFFNYNGY